MALVSWSFVIFLMKYKPWTREPSDSWAASDDFVKEFDSFVPSKAYLLLPRYALNELKSHDQKDTNNHKNNDKYQYYHIDEESIHSDSILKASEDDLLMNNDGAPLF